jgi:hypothetical protein
MAWVLWLVVALVCVAASAQLLSSAGPFNLADQDTLNLTVNGTPASTITLNAKSATCDSIAIGSPSGLNFTGGKVLNVRFGQGADVGPTQVVSFVNGDFVDPANPTITELITKLNSSLVGGHAEVYVSGGNKIRLVDDIYGSNSGVLVSASTANSLLSFPTSQQNPSGTQNCANVSKVTPAELKTKVDAAAISGIVTSVVGSTFKIVTSATGVSATLQAAGTIQPKIGFASGSQTGTNAVSATDTLKIVAKTEGVWADGIQFTVTDNAVDGDLFDLTIPAQTGIDTPEVHSGLSMNKSDSVNYVVTRLLVQSRYVDAIDQNSAKSIPYKNPQTATYTLTGGNDGLSGLTGTDWVGTANSGLGVHAFDNVLDTMDLHAPGLTDRVTIQSIATYADSRKDITFFASFPNPTNAQDCADFVNAQGAYVGQGTMFNTRYLSFYFDRAQEVGFSGSPQYLDPHGHIAAALVFNDTGGGVLATDFGPWFAPAGIKRAKLNALGVEKNVGSPGLSSLASLLEANQINSVRDEGQGVILYDQRTMLRTNSAFKDLNVSRLMIMIRRDVTGLVRTDQWDPADPVTWRATWRRLDPYFQDLGKRRALYSYRLECDQNADSVDKAVVNTAIDIDNGVQRVLIFVKPGRAIREIKVVTTVTSTSVNFDELIGELT